MHTVMSVAQHIILEALRSIPWAAENHLIKRGRFARQGLMLFLFLPFRLRNYIKEGGSGYPAK